MSRNVSHYLFGLVILVGCQRAETDRDSAKSSTEDFKEIQATQVEIDLNGAAVANEFPTIKVGAESTLVARFKLPVDVDNLPDTSLKAVHTRSDGKEVVRSSLRGTPQKLPDGSYEVSFSLNAFKQPMDMEVRIQSGFQRVPYVVANFDLRIVE